MTPTPEQIAALAEALFAQEPHVCDPRFLTCAAAILAALPDWTLVPTGEVERLRRIEEAARAVCESPCHTPELEPTTVFDALRAVLAGPAA